MRSGSIRYIVLLIVWFAVAPVQSQDDWGISVSANYSQPIAGLNDWFNPTTNFGFGVGKMTRSNWFLEGMVTYTEYTDENLSGYAADNLKLQLEHVGFVVNGRYFFSARSSYNLYLNLGAGLYYWKGIRGEIAANPDLEPTLPFIEQRVLEEWNWGMRAGIGVEIDLMDNVAVDVVGYYRFIVGELWPTLQPHIVLESVSGFQSVNATVQLRYYLN